MITHAMNEATKMPDGREASPIASRSPAQSVDPDTYIQQLQEIGLSEEQSRDLHAVFETIARGFVEYAWSGEVCGQLLDGFQAVLSSAVEPLKSSEIDQEEKGEHTP